MKKAIACILVLCMILSLAACGKEQVNEGPKDQPNTTQNPTPTSGGESNPSDTAEDNTKEYFRGDIMVFKAKSTGESKARDDKSITIYSNSIDGCDPAGRMAEYTWCENVYESLFWKDSATGEYKPLLATEWSFDADGNFHATLREGVKFHDGTTLDAEDVLYTIKRTQGKPKSGANTTMQAVDIEKSYAEDDLHVVIVFKDDCPAFMNYMASSFMGIVSKEFCEKMGDDFDFMSADAGSGAYKIVETVTGTRQVFEAFDEWWGGEVDIQKVTAINYKDLNSMFIDFENRDLDVAFLNTYDSVSRVLAGEVTDCTYYNVPNNRGLQLCMATIGDTTPFADIRVRQALSLCLDYNGIIEGVYGSTDIASVPTSQLLAGNTTDVGVFNLDKAVSLMKEAGYSEANPLHVQLETSNNAFSVACAEMIQYYASKAYFDIEVISETSHASANAQNATEVPAAFNLILANFVYSIDPQGFWLGCDAYGKEIGEFSGVKGVDDKTASELLTRLQTETDEVARAVVVKELEEYWTEMVYYIPVAFTTSAVTVQEYLENVEFRSGYHFYWANATFAE